MNARFVIPGIVAVLVLAILLALAWRSQHVLETGLPPRTVCQNDADALTQATQYAAANGGTVVPILGTGSMAPYIPAAPAGAEPLQTVVAYVVTIPAATYADIGPGTLCSYRPEWAAPAAYVMHQAAQRDRFGWIMSGLHNARSEASWRVTPDNFVGIVAHTFIW